MKTAKTHGNLKGKEWKKFSLAFTLCLTLCGAFTPVQAAIGTDQRLAQLEVKFFKHPYPKDDDTARLERLEKMIFGEARSGNDMDRLKALADTVPNLSSISITGEEPEDAPSKPAANTAARSGGTGGAGKSNTMDVQDRPVATSKGGTQVLTGESKYPSITALEQSLFQKDYASEPVNDRLNRLETKVFGKPSKFTDLSERVDALKDRTRIDIAKKAPPGSDWVEDDEDDDMNRPPARQANRFSDPIPRQDGDDGRSFSGRDLRKDMQKAFGSAYPGGGSYGTGGGASNGGSYGSGNSASGAYGMGSGSGSYGSSGGGSFGRGGGTYSAGRSGSSGGVGLIDPEDDDAPAPRSAPPRQMASAAGGGSQKDAPMMGAVGISQKVASLEAAVLGQSYGKDPLPVRVERLEKTVIPKQAEANANLSLPDRVQKLLEKVPIASAKPSSRPPRGGRRSSDDFDDDDMDMDMGTGFGSSMGSMGSGMSGGQIATGKAPGGLSKIINSLGNLMGSGYYSTGYGMPSGTMVRDPSTGYLVDTMTGNMINPSTGAVMGRTTAIPGGIPMGGLGGVPITTSPLGSTLGTAPLGGYSGMPYGTVSPYGMASPYGTVSPYGGGYGGYGYPGYNSFNNGFSPYGMGGGGIRFGTGGFGFGTGGMRWP